jgi:hypothetical protein
VGLDQRGVDEQPRWQILVRGQGMEDALPSTVIGPPHEAVVERLLGAIVERTIAPAPAAAQRMDNSREHAAIIHAGNAARVARQQRLDPRPLLIGKPKQIRHDFTLLNGK